MTTFDAHKNFAVSAVATAPSPAASGTSLVVSAGHGARFPAVPFNAIIWPTASAPTPLNAEVVRVTVIATDTLTITRTQEGSSARTIIVGDQIAAAITAKTLTDIEVKARGAATLAADKSTTSASFVDVDATNAAVTLVTTGGDVLVGWAGPIKANGNDALLALSLDAVDSGVLAGEGVSYAGLSGDRHVSITRLYTGLAAGSHTWKLRFRNNNGATSISVNGSTKINGLMFAVEL